MEPRVWAGMRRGVLRGDCVGAEAEVVPTK